MIRDGAAAVVIGNEVLTAKLVDQNGPLLISRLRARGIPLHGLYTVPDDVDAIVEALGLARRRARWIITSGGIGPTHDDVTVRAVSLALGRRVVRLPEMVALLHAAWKGEPVPTAALRMAEGPEGTELIAVPGAKFPVLSCDGVFLLPGVPSYFRRQLDVVLARLPGRPMFCANVHLAAAEPDIAQALDAVALAVPHVAIGSYPRLEPGQGWRVKLTVEHPDAGVVADVVARLLAALPPGCVTGVDPAASAQREPDALP